MIRYRLVIQQRLLLISESTSASVVNHDFYVEKE